jgi:hypothetical protein
VSPFRGPSYHVAEDIIHALAVSPDDESDEKEREGVGCDDEAFNLST